MAGLHHVARARLRVDGHLDRVGAVVRRDAGGDALARLDRHGERRLERRLVLRRHQVQAQLVAARGGERKADQPAPVGGHEVDGLGRGELGGQREVALVLAVLGVADHHHLPGPDVLDRLLDGAEGRAHDAPPPTAARAAFSAYLASTSTSRFTVRPGSAAPKRRPFERLRDQRHGEAGVVHLEGRERHAVHRDRALVHHVAEDLRWSLHHHDPGEAVLGHPRHRAGAVHVALDHVTAEPVAGPKRQLQVHLVARGERSQASCAPASPPSGRPRIPRRRGRAPLGRRRSPRSSRPAASSPASAVRTRRSRAAAVALDRRRRCPVPPPAR